MFPRGVPGKVKAMARSPPCLPNGPPVSAGPPKGLCFRHRSAPWGERDRGPRRLGFRGPSAGGGVRLAGSRSRVARTRRTTCAPPPTNEHSGRLAVGGPAPLLDAVLQEGEAKPSREGEELSRPFALRTGELRDGDSSHGGERLADC